MLLWKKIASNHLPPPPPPISTLQFSLVSIYLVHQPIYLSDSVMFFCYNLFGLFPSNCSPPPPLPPVPFFPGSFFVSWWFLLLLLLLLLLLFLLHLIYYLLLAGRNCSPAVHLYVFLQLYALIAHKLWKLVDEQAIIHCIFSLSGINVCLNQCCDSVGHNSSLVPAKTTMGRQEKCRYI